MSSTYHEGEVILPAHLSGRDKSAQYVESISAQGIATDVRKIREIFEGVAFVSRRKKIGKSEAHIADNHINVICKKAQQEFDDATAASVRQFIANSDTFFRFQKHANTGYLYKKTGIDLFSGISGLAYSLSKTHSEIISDLQIREFFHAYAASIRAEASASLRIGGAYVGICSALIPLLELARKLQDPGLFEANTDVVKQILWSSVQSRNNWHTNDLVGGLSGALIVTYSIYKSTRDNDFLDIAKRLFSALVDDSTLLAETRYFPSLLGVSCHPEMALCGLSHGQAGIAYAISVCQEVGATLGYDVKKLVQETLQFEISYYDESTGSWPDFRIGSIGENGYNYSWAYGSPGAALAFRYILGVFDIDSLNILLSKLMSAASNQADRALYSQYKAGDFTVSSGVIGICGAIKRLQWTAPRSDSTMLNMLISSLGNDLSKDAPGLMNGIAGKLLATRAVSMNDWDNFPLLPHELID